MLYNDMELISCNEHIYMSHIHMCDRMHYTWTKPKYPKLIAIRKLWWLSQAALVCVCVYVCVCPCVCDLVSVGVVGILWRQGRDHRRLSLTLDVHRQQHGLERHRGIKKSFLCRWSFYVTASGTISTISTMSTELVLGWQLLHGNNR